MNDLVQQIVAECAAYTMLQPERLEETLTFMLSLARSTDFPGGNIVECGTWKGGMALGATRIFGVERSYQFYDSFEGLPAPNERDGADAHWWRAHPNHPRFFDNCRADFEEMHALMREARPHHTIEIFKGWFKDTLEPKKIAPIAWAHIDCDWYDSTYLCLERLWPCMAPGGIIAIDDYYDWEGCRRAVHDFLSHNQAREAIERIGKCGGIAIKRLGPWQVSESPHLA